MEQNIRNNIIELATIYLNTDTFNEENNDEDLTKPNFTAFLYKELFNLDIEKSGYGLDPSTKQMTNDLGDLKIYQEKDHNKIKYLTDIKPGDLLFFHTKALDDQTPSPNNKYPGHVGIYTANNNFIHLSPNTGKIIIETLTDNHLNTLVASRDIIKYILTKNNITN